METTIATMMTTATTNMIIELVKSVCHSESCDRLKKEGMMKVTSDGDVEAFHKVVKFMREMGPDLFFSVTISMLVQEYISGGHNINVFLKDLAEGYIGIEKVWDEAEKLNYSDLGK